MQKTWVQSLGWEDPLEEGMATHSSILAWRIPWTEEPGGLQSIWSQSAGHDWSDWTCTHTHTQIYNYSLSTPWRPGSVHYGSKDSPLFKPGVRKGQIGRANVPSRGSRAHQASRQDWAVPLVTFRSGSTLLFQKPPRTDPQPYPISLWHLQEPHSSQPSKKMGANRINESFYFLKEWFPTQKGFLQTRWKDVQHRVDPLFPHV